MISFRSGIVALIALTSAPLTTHAANPIFEGWYADPEVAVFNNEYWIYPTASIALDKQTFLDAFSSKDLVTWTKHPSIIDTKEVKWAKRAMWAPCTVEKDGKYYLFFSANTIHPGQVGGIGIGVSDQPGGPFKDYLGKPLIGDYVNGAQPIDQAVFQDTDGQWYIIYGGLKRCNIAKLKDDFTGFIPFEDGQTFRDITPENYMEGPIIFRRDGKVYFMWSEGGWGDSTYRVAYAMSDSIFGPFKRIGTVIVPDDSIGGGAGHHSVLNPPGTNDWYIVYHRRPPGDKDSYHRVTCIDKMEFAPDGTIKPVTMTNEGVPPQKIP